MYVRRGGKRGVAVEDDNDDDRVIAIVDRMREDDEGSIII